VKRALMLAAAFFLVAFLVPTGAQGAPPTFDQAIDQLFAQGDPQAAEDYLLSLGTNPDLGFRWTGTSADDAAAEFLRDQLETAGLSNVRLEPVPVDVFEFSSASVQVGDRLMTASTFAGVPPTPPEGLTGQVVYVHDGTAADFRAYGRDFDWTDKIVLVDSALDYWWMNLPGAEAAFHGAKGVILTKGPHSTDWYTYKRDTLGSNDGEYDMSFAPMVYVSWKDGTWLKDHLSTAVPLTATMTYDADVTLADDGGVGYNVVGEIPGAVDDGTFLLFASHHDCHFRDAQDDTGAVVTELSIAKAMMMSGYQPEHTVVFMFTTAEEYGYTNSWYDWSIGAWYAITQAHPDWAGRIRAFINMEQMASGGPLQMGTSPDLAPWLRSEVNAQSSLLTMGYEMNVPATTWQDTWTFTAAGVPSVVFSADGTPDGTYHTQYRIPEFLVWSDLAKIAKSLHLVQDRLDGGLLPYRLPSRADEVAGVVDVGALREAGVDPAIVDRLASAVRGFSRAADAYQEHKGQIPEADQVAANQTLLEIQRLINGNLTALSAWDWTVYPHEQVLNDVSHLNRAISAFARGTDGTRPERAQQRGAHLVRPVLQPPGLPVRPDASRSVLPPGDVGRAGTSDQLPRRDPAVPGDRARHVGRQHREGPEGDAER
jgi:hypothetical protein